MASQGALLHEEYTVLSARCGYGVRESGLTGILTNAQVVAATGVADLITDAQNVPATVHQEYQTWEPLQTIASLNFGQAIGDFSASRVQAATSVENLAENTNAADETDLGHIAQGPL